MIPFLEVVGAEETQGGVSTLGVVVNFQVLKDHGLSVGAVLYFAAKDEFLFEGAEEAFAWSIVPAVSFATHAAHDAVGV